MTNKIEINYNGINFTVEYDFTPDDPSVGFKSELDIISIIHKGTDFLDVLNIEEIDNELHRNIQTSKN